MRLYGMIDITKVEKFLIEQKKRRNFCASNCVTQPNDG